MWITWLGCFFVGASLSLVVPFMSLYIEELGTKGSQVEVYSGLAISISSLAAAIMSPIWGMMADKYGRKTMMVRASFAMTFTMGGMAFVPNVYWLVFLRLLNGVFAGYVPNGTALIASQVPKERSGYALGTLSTGVVAGTLLGPLLGGFIAENLGMSTVFLLVGCFLFFVTLLTIFGIKEDFVPVTKEEQIPTKDLLQNFSHKGILVSLFITTMVIQIAAQSIGPILPLYIRSLGQTDNLVLVSGFIVSAMGLSSILSSSVLGRLGDKVGNHRLLIGAQVYSVIIYLLCANAHSTVELGLYRFLFGLGTGALIPGVNSLLNKLTPKEGVSRIFSFNQTFFYIGGVLGPMLGAAVATGLSYNWVFYATAGLVAISFSINFLQFRKYLGEKEIQ